MDKKNKATRYRQPDRIRHPEKIRHFDFSVKPKKPGPLFSVAKHILAWPDLRRRHAKIDKVNMESLEGKPYLLLVTHSYFCDFAVMMKVTHPHPVINVMTLEGFNTYSAPLMRALGVIGKRKFVQDFHLIRNMKYTVEKLKCIFCLFPEARYSLDGCGSYIPESTASLVKLLGVPVVVLRIHGNFVTCPQWNKIDKGTYIEGRAEPIITAQETQTLSKEEIFTRIRTNFTYDDFRWQAENRIRIDHPRRAEGLHCLLYKCPHCGKEYETDSAGTELWCRACGKRWEMDVYGQLHAKEGKTEYPHIPDWSAWERDCVRHEILSGTYRFESEARIETLPGWKKFYKHGSGRLIQDMTGTYVICDNLYGKGEFTLHKKPLELDSVHIEYDYLGRGDAVDISVPDDSFWCYIRARDAITKLSFATEELYQNARARRQVPVRESTLCPAETPSAK